MCTFHEIKLASLTITTTSVVYPLSNPLVLVVNRSMTNKTSFPSIITSRQTIVKDTNKQAYNNLTATNIHTTPITWQKYIQFDYNNNNNNNQNQQQHAHILPQISTKSTTDQCFYPQVCVQIMTIDDNLITVIMMNFICYLTI